MSLEIQVELAEVGLDSQRLERVRRHFDRYVEDRRLAGWQCTVARAGELAWVGSGGHLDRERVLPVVDDTLWRIYSMTKPITSIAAMLLYEEGRFDLNDDVGQWIDDLAEPRVWTGGTPDEPESAPATGPVRVHHLLTHMSGLTYGFQYAHPVDAIYRAKGYDFLYPDGADLTRAVHDWCSTPLLFDPGSAWNYSVSTDVLGRLIEIWSGERLDAFIARRVLEPLDMFDTHWWCPPDALDRLAMLYVPHQGDSFAYGDLAHHARVEPLLLGGGGGMLSSARDYHRFTTMLLRGGELDGVRLLSSRTLELMTLNHLPGDVDLQAFAVDSFSETDYAGVGFGLGFSVRLDRRANKSMASEGTFGWGGAASTVFWVDPLEELSVCFFTQLLPSGTYPIRRELEQLIYQALND